MSHSKDVGRCGCEAKQVSIILGHQGLRLLRKVYSLWNSPLQPQLLVDFQGLLSARDLVQMPLSAFAASWSAFVTTILRVQTKELAIHRRVLPNSHVRSIYGSQQTHICTIFTLEKASHMISHSFPVALALSNLQSNLKRLPCYISSKIRLPIIVQDLREQTLYFVMQHQIPIPPSFRLGSWRSRRRGPLFRVLRHQPSSRLRSKHVLKRGDGP